MANNFSALPAAWERTAKGDANQVTRTDLLTARTTGIADAEHVNVSGGAMVQLVRPREDYKVAGLSYDSWEDVDISRGECSFGKPCTFHFGLEGGALVTGIELHAKLSAIDLDGGATRDVEWRPFIGELLLGRTYSVKLQQEKVEDVDVDAMHFERRLMADVASASDDGYLAAVGAEASSGSQHVWCPLRIPYNRNRPLVALALPQEHALTFTIPQIADLVRYVPTAAGATPTAVGAGADAQSVLNNPASYATPPAIEELFLRVHYTNVDQASRYEMAQMALKQGHKYHISHIEVAGDYEAMADGSGSTAGFTSAANGEAEIEIKTDVLKTLAQPSAFLFFVVRDRLDLSAVTGSVGVGAMFAENPSPDRFRSAAPLSWQLFENNARIYNRFTFDYYCAQLHPKYFNSEVYQPIGVISHTPHPSLADSHSLGHMTYSNLNQPNLRVAFRKAPYLAGEAVVLKDTSRVTGTWTSAAPAAVDYAGAAVSYVVSVWSMALNFVYLQSGRVYVAYT